MFLFYRNVSTLSFFKPGFMRLLCSRWLFTRSKCSRRRFCVVSFWAFWGNSLRSLFPLGQCLPHSLDSFLLLSRSLVTRCGMLGCLKWFRSCPVLEFSVAVTLRSHQIWILSSSPHQPAMGPAGLPEPLSPHLPNRRSQPPQRVAMGLSE